MKRMLFNATYAEELRVASVEGQKLINFDIETSSKEQRRGNLYKGVITRVEPSLEACFVDYGTEKQGFLPFKEIDYRYLPEVNGLRSRDFSKIPVGAEIIVQVEKDERGNKGAALTSYATLPGRYLVLMPNNPRAGGISRRIEGEERDELKTLMGQLDIPQGMSVILRTAALGRLIDELQWDLTYLLKLWSAVRNAAVEHKGAFLIYQESSLVIRSIRDHFAPDIAEILIDTEEVYNTAREFMQLVMPNFADRIKLYYDDVPLFSRFQIEHQIESAYSRQISLPSGGAIVIDYTEALTSIDVNSARANKGADIETTALLTNLESAEEVARQLRLRDLGGLVVVDFIDMENPRNQRDLENHFKAQLGLDRARIQMGKLSKFGLLELSRQRLQASLDESSSITCPRCSGVGTIRGVESSALHVLRIIQEETIKNGNNLSALHVQLPVDVATYLLNERREDVAKIEARMKVRIVLIPNLHLDSPNYKIKKINYDTYDANFSKSSYSLVEIPEEGLGYKTGAKKAEAMINKPALVQNIAPSQAAPRLKNAHAKSILSVLAQKISSFFNPKPVVKPSKHSLKITPAPRNTKVRLETSRLERNTSNQRTKAEGSTVGKTRPVTVAKSNQKIQTVRPATVDTTKSAEVNLASARAERSLKNQAQRTAMKVSVLDTVVVPASPPVRVISEESLNPKPIIKEQQPAEFIIAEDRINIAAKTEELASIYTSSESGSAIAHTAAVIKEEVVTATETAVTALAVIEDKLIIAPKTNILLADVFEPNKVVVIPTEEKLVMQEPIKHVVEPIDLGELKLVKTKAELLNVAHNSDLVAEKVKRFCDLPITEKIAQEEPSYQQVKTKVE